MLTLILPGFSPHNRDWALSVKERLGSKHKSEIIFWKHWQTQNPLDFSIQEESEKIISEIRRYNEAAPAVEGQGQRKDSRFAGNAVFLASFTPFEKAGNFKARNKINLISKSIGTLVAMLVLKKEAPKIAKIILCGLPINDIKRKDLEYYQILSKFPGRNILCFQNKNDPHGEYANTCKFLNTINTEILIKEGSRDDHEYPYFDAFTDFLEA